MAKLDAKLRSRMVLHGCLVIMLSLVAGFPYALAILGQGAEVSRAWSAVHTGGILNGLLVMAAAAAARRTVLNVGRLSASWPTVS